MTRTKWYQKPAYLLLALALVLSLGIMAVPMVPRAAASPDEATFYSSNLDGYLSLSGMWFDYSAAHAASPGQADSDNDRLPVGQELGGNGFGIFRGAVFFDTSSLPDDTIITSATLSLYGRFDGSTTDFQITVVGGSLLHEPLEGADYGYLRNQTVSGGTFDTAGFSTSGYNNIPLNETGMGWISKTGITKFGLRSSREIAATEPGGAEFVYVCTREHTGGNEYWPKLVVTHTTPIVGVGGEAYPVNKISILTPWIAVGILLTGGLIWHVLRRRRFQV